MSQHQNVPDLPVSRDECARLCDSWLKLKNPAQALAWAHAGADDARAAVAASAWDAQRADFDARRNKNRAQLASRATCGKIPEVSNARAAALAGCMTGVTWGDVGRGLEALRFDDGRLTPIAPRSLPAAVETMARTAVPYLWTGFQSIPWLRAFLANRPDGFLGMRQPIYIVVPDAELFALWLDLEDLSDVFDRPEVFWHVGADWDAQLSALLSERPLLLPPTQVISLGAPTAASEALTRMFAERAARRERCIAQLADHYAALEADIDRRWVVRGAPPRVFLITTRYTTVLQYATRDLESAFRQLGCATELVIERDEAEQLTSDGVLTQMAAFSPDIVVQIDALRPHLPFIDHRPLHVCWIQDRLPRLFDREVIAALGTRDLVFAMWPQVLAECRAAGYPELELLPVAANTAVYNDAARVRSEFVHDIAFVSHVEPPPLAGPVEPIVRAALELIPQIGYGNGVRAHYAELLERIENRLGVRVNDSSRVAILHLLEVQVERYVQRTEPIRWARELGHDVRVYGRGWDQMEEFRSIAAGPVTPGGDLRDLYRSARIHLQINTDTNVHPRLFECLAAGGMLLARAHPGDTARGGLGDFLALDREVLTYRDREDFATKVNRLLGEPEWRAGFVARGQAAVHARHTTVDRARQILGVARRRAEMLLQSEGVCAEIG
ncbi:MAG: glycosyltransferase [Planctomycetota bacterium]